MLIELKRTQFSNHEQYVRDLFIFHSSDLNRKEIPGIDSMNGSTFEGFFPGWLNNTFCASI